MDCNNADREAPKHRVHSSCSDTPPAVFLINKQDRVLTMNLILPNSSEVTSFPDLGYSLIYALKHND